MEFIVAKQAHLEDLCRITEEAKRQIRALGFDQWQKGYPSREIWQEDIRQGITWLAVEKGNVLGAFAFQTEPDPSYAEIEGAWLSSQPYASMHRVCVSDESKGSGVAGAMFRHGFAMAKEQGFPSMRIDTHADNRPMQRALAKAGFQPCGTIILKGGSEDGSPRIAFEKLL